MIQTVRDFANRHETTSGAVTACVALMASRALVALSSQADPSQETLTPVSVAVTVAPFFGVLCTGTCYEVKKQITHKVAFLGGIAFSSLALLRPLDSIPALLAHAMTTASVAMASLHGETIREELDELKKA